MLRNDVKTTQFPANQHESASAVAAKDAFEVASSPSKKRTDSMVDPAPRPALWTAVFLPWIFSVITHSEAR